MVPPLGRDQGEDSVSSECEYIARSIDIAKCSCLFLKGAPNNTSCNDLDPFCPNSHAYYNRPRLCANYLSYESGDIKCLDNYDGRVTFEEVVCRDADKTTFNSNLDISAHLNL